MLHGLSAGDIIIEYCRHLPELNKYISQWDDSKTDEVKCIPNTIAEANALRQSFKGLLNDIDITVKVLTLPLLEPLTNTRLTSLTKVVLGTLIASVSVATAQSLND